MKKTVLFIVCVLAAAGLFAVDINDALDTAAKQFSSSLKAGTTVAIVGIASDTEAMSEYLLDEMTIRIVQNRKLTVADRGNLEAIKKEMDFQLSGEVSDASIKEIGAMVGADVVILGSLTTIGDIFMLTLQALDVTKATVLDMYRADVELDEKGKKLVIRESVKNTHYEVLKNTYYEDFSVGEIFLTGFGNLFFGLGSLIAGYPLDTALIALTEAMGVGAIFLDPIIGCDDILALTLAPSCFIFSACWAFICPVTYQKSVVRYAYGGYNEGFSFQFVPFEDNLGIKLSYKKTF